MDANRRIPKKGDKVGAKGHHGPLEVIDVNEKAKTVDAKASGAKGPVGNIQRGIPWHDLVFMINSTTTCSGD